jgi:hypothetical protein
MTQLGWVAAFFNVQPRQAQNFRLELPFQGKLCVKEKSRLPLNDPHSQFLAPELLRPRQAPEGVVSLAKMRVFQASLDSVLQD